MLTLTYVSFASMVFDVSKGQGFCSGHLTMHRPLSSPHTPYSMHLV